MQKDINIRKIFIEEFTRAIIKSRYFELNPKKSSEIIEELSKDDSILSSKNLSKSIEKKIETAFKTPPPHTLQKIIITKPRPLFPQPIKRINVSAPLPTNINQGKNPNIEQKIDSPMQKISHLLEDQYVKSIECKGPGKPIVVLKSGIIQVTNIILSKEEIDSIMKEFSNQTKIPLMEGLFKAVLNNLSITSVISEFVGTRFVIEKRKQF